ncbi:MAG: amidohydrolase [Firmicutes bacterium]|nr:amidohydrolase [Bacillota bacterium]
MQKEELKKKVARVIDEKRDRIIALGKKMYDKPELGYKEKYATDLLYEEFKDLGLVPKKNIAVTGCSAVAGENPGPRIAFMGELDAILCHEHPDADQETGAVHACGHNIQSGVMLGAALGLVLSGAFSELSGSVKFMAVPAEEYVELEYRCDLREKGKIKYFGGKQELIYRGELDDVDIAMMIHSLYPGDSGIKALLGPTGNGFVGKKVQFTGKESHAGSAPEEGVNALNAAMLAINNIHAQRETFPDEEKIRVHPIITKGGDIVNIVPADVRMESYVRGRTVKGIIAANQKVNRAIKAGAMAVGAKVEINDIPGYLPLLNKAELDHILLENLSAFIKEDEIQQGSSFAGSFDFGDVSHLMPALHPFFGGVKGDLHTRDFEITDEELAYIIPAKTMAMTVIDLLYDKADKATTIIENHQTVMTKEEYLDLLSSFDKTT